MMLSSLNTGWFLSFFLILLQCIVHAIFTLYETQNIFICFLEEMIYGNTSKFIKEMDKHINDNHLNPKEDICAEKVKEIKSQQSKISST